MSWSHYEWAQQFDRMQIGINAIPFEPSTNMQLSNCSLSIMSTVPTAEYTRKIWNYFELIAGRISRTNKYRRDTQMSYVEYLRFHFQMQTRVADTKNRLTHRANGKFPHAITRFNSSGDFLLLQKLRKFRKKKTILSRIRNANIMHVRMPCVSVCVCLALGCFRVSLSSSSSPSSVMGNQNGDDSQIKINIWFGRTVVRSFVALI